MTSTASISKPVSLSEHDWHNLLLAAHTGWFAYVLSWRWLLLSISASAVGAFLGSFSSSRYLPTVWHHFLVSGFFTWGLGFLLGFRVLFRSIDRVGKRKLARQLGLLPSTSAPNNALQRTQAGGGAGSEFEP